MIRMLEQKLMEEEITKGLANDELIKEYKSFKIMKPKFIECSVEGSVTFSFPVLEWELNGYGTMQGGFIVAAFDNAFGILGFYMTGGALFTTIDITTSYQRPVFMGDELTVRVYIKSLGKNIVHMNGEAYNKENKLVATSSTNIMKLQQ